MKTALRSSRRSTVSQRLKRVIAIRDDWSEVAGTILHNKQPDVGTPWVASAGFSDWKTDGSGKAINVTNTDERLIGDIGFQPTEVSLETIPGWTVIGYGQGFELCRSSDGQQAYVIYYGAWNASTMVLRIYKLVNGSFEGGTYKTQYSASPGTDLIIGRVKNGLVEVFLNGVLRASYQDPSPLPMTSKVALWIDNNGSNITGWSFSPVTVKAV